VPIRRRAQTGLRLKEKQTIWLTQLPFFISLLLFTCPCSHWGLRVVGMTGVKWLLTAINVGSIAVAFAKHFHTSVGSRRLRTRVSFLWSHRTSAPTRWRQRATTSNPRATTRCWIGNGRCLRLRLLRLPLTDSIPFTETGIFSRYNQRRGK
jgi:hypothetical protein